jgi:hypothetical protein
MKTNQVLQGDCLELLPSIPSKSIDMILCDLPYGTTACSWDSIIPLDRLWAEYERVIKDNGNIVLTAQGVFCAELICYRKTWFNHDYVWIKNQHSNFALAGIQPLRVFENVLVFRPPRREDKPMIFNQELRTYFKQVHDFIGLTAEKIAKIIGDTGYHHSYGVNGIQFRLCTQNTYDKLIACFKIDQMQGYLTYETLRSMNRDFFDPFTFNFDDRVKSITKTYSNGFAYDMYKGDNKKIILDILKKNMKIIPETPYIIIVSVGYTLLKSPLRCLNI